MRPAPFSYFAPDSLDEVLALLAQYGDDARVLAGGQSLIPLMSLRMGRPEVLIDLNRCAELATIERREGHVAYGAMVRQIDAQHSALTMAECPLVAKAVGSAGPIAIRNRGTVGGTIAHADRSAELPGAVVALDATMVIASASGEREVSAAEFFLGDMTTAVDTGEMLREVRVPQCDPAAFSSFREVGLREEGVAIAGLAAEVEFNGKAVRRARLAVIGVDSAPLRLSRVEADLVGSTIDEQAIAEAVAHATSVLEPVDDAHASARYRRHVVGSLLRRTLEDAREGCR